MLTKRIIPCLDIQQGRTVKGIRFVDIKDAGDPVALSLHYAEAGADELVFLDITATQEKRKTLLDLVRDVAATINIPFTVGGGVAAVDDVALLLRNGADKIAINTAAVKRPQLINEIATTFGSQCVVVAIDAKIVNGLWKVHLLGGKLATPIDMFDWAKEAQDRGAGEILFTAIDHDGTKKGFANAALARLSATVNIPIIASGGAGCIKDFIDVFEKGKADAALAASVFHYGDIDLQQLKQELKNNNLAIRL